MLRRDEFEKKEGGGREGCLAGLPRAGEHFCAELFKKKKREGGKRPSRFVQLVHPLSTWTAARVPIATESYYSLPERGKEEKLLLLLASKQGKRAFM